MINVRADFFTVQHDNTTPDDIERIIDKFRRSKRTSPLVVRTSLLIRPWKWSRVIASAVQRTL